MYKIDMHVHTSEVSSCGKVSAGELVELYKSLGYDAVVITDHFYRDYFFRQGDLSWPEKVDCFLRGYTNALSAGRKLGLDVLLGMEIRFTESANDYLVFGIDEAFLKVNENLFDHGLSGFMNLARAEGLMVCQAHPFRPGMVTAPPELLDGVEVFNGNPRHNSGNELAYEFARTNNLKMLSGSDFHQYCDAGRGGLLLKERIRDSKHLVQALRDNDVLEILTSAS